jgi:hypothetical protein
MEPVQEHFVKFNSSTLHIYSVGAHAVEEAGFTIMPVKWELIEPFFTQFKNLSDYFPLFENGSLIGFRKKKMIASQIVKNDDSETVKSIQPYENFIADCAINIRVKDTSIQLTYDSHYFNAVDNQENIDRLTLVKGNQYNIHITQKGNPYFLYDSRMITLDNFLEGKPIEIEYSGPKDISVYVVAKN